MTAPSAVLAFDYSTFHPTGEANVDCQDHGRSACSVGGFGDAGTGAAGDVRARLLRVLLSKRQLPEQGTGQSLHRPELPRERRSRLGSVGERATSCCRAEANAPALRGPLRT